MDGSLPSFEERMTCVRSTHELEDQIIELAGHLNAANYRFLSLLAELDRRKGWNCRATRDCAHWLNWNCGIDLGAAREKVRAARALEKLPLVTAAMERGEISYSNVRAITRVATPENAVVGALVLKAMEAAVPETPPDNVERPSRSRKRADALAVIFESLMAHGAEAMSGGERHQVVVHVSAETLRTGGGHQCEIERRRCRIS
jgi:hypothetical protein